MNIPSYRSSASGAVMSTIRLEPDLIAKVIPINDALYQGAFMRRSIVAPQDCAMYFINKHGQVMGSITGSVSTNAMERLLELNRGYVLLVRSVPVTLTVHISTEGAYQEDLQAKDGFTIDGIFTAVIDDPVRFANTMGLTTLHASLPYTDVESRLSTALLQAIATQGRKILFSTRETIRQSLKSLPDIGLRFTAFSVTKYTSDVNDRLAAMRDENDAFRQDARRMLLRQLDNYATSTQRLLEAAIANNAPPEVIDSVMDRYGRIIETITERVERAGLLASPQRQTALHSTNVPRLSGTVAQNSGTPAQNICTSQIRSPRAQAAGNSRFGH